MLKGAKGPLGCGEIVQRAASQGLWTSSGKTPASTIYAAILREITTKAGESRFRKAERGKFTLAARVG